jgi:hypothetical protein
MKPFSRVAFTRTLAAACVLGISAIVSTGQTEPAAEKPTLQTLSWLTGTWHWEKDGRSGTEVWMSPEGGTMVGMSRTISKGKTAEYELLLLRQDDKGGITYVARPVDQKEVPFKMTSGSATEAVFENPKHDFPQKITYTLNADGSMLAAIEGKQKGKTRRLEFPFQKKTANP